MTARKSAAKALPPLGRIYKNGARSDSKLLYLFVPGGYIFSVLPGFCLPISYVGHLDAPHPVLNSVLDALLPLGLLFTAVGHRMCRGQWKGVSEQLHVKLALAGLAFALTTARYALAGMAIHFYPAGVLLLISGILCASRLLMKFVAHNHYPWERPDAGCAS